MSVNHPGQDLASRLFPGDGLHRPGIQFAQATSDLDTPLGLGVFIDFRLEAFDQTTGGRLPGIY